MATIIVSKNTTGTYANTGYTGFVDTKLRGLNPTTNYSTDTTFATTSWDKSGGDVETTVLKADISSVSAGTVSNSEIGFYLDNGNNVDSSGVSLFALLVDFVETQATFNIRKTSTNWNTGGARGSGTDRQSTAFITVSRPATSGAWIQFSGTAVDDMVQDWLDGTLTNNGFVAELQNHDIDPFFTFQSYISSEGTDGNRPYLKFDHTPSATDYSINAETGSYAVTGVSATTVSDRSVNAETGSYTTTGVLASLVPGYSINAETGSYSVTGVNASLIADYSINIETGSYSISGIDASLDFTPVGNYEINAETGSYSITGIEALIVADRAINAEVGLYSITGLDALLIADRSINAESGAYSLTGIDAELLFELPAGVYVLNAETGSYSVNGIDVAFDAPSRATDIAGGVRGSRRRRIIIEREEEKEEEPEVIVRKVKRLIARKITNRQIAQKVQEQVVEAVKLEFIDLTQAQKLIDDLKQQEIIARIRKKQMQDDEEAIQFFL